MHIVNARLRNQEGLHELHLENGLISHISRQTEAHTLGPEDLDAGGNLVVPPFVEPPHSPRRHTDSRRAALEHERHAVRRHRVLG